MSYSFRVLLIFHSQYNELNPISYYNLITKLENNTVTVIDLHNTICCFRNSLTSRINEKFF